MTKNFKKILIYGVNGFIGKNLVVELSKSNFDVYAISSSNEIKCSDKDLKYFKKVKFIKYYNLQKYKIDYVLLNSSPNNHEKDKIVFNKSFELYKILLSKFNKDTNIIYLSSGIVLFKDNLDKSNDFYRSYKNENRKVNIESFIKK